MFFNQKLKSIQEDKDRLALCCDLRRRLVLIEVQDIRRGVRRAYSYLTLGLAVGKRILVFLRGRKNGHH